MENHTFLVFLFTISIGVLFIGGGITGLYSFEMNYVESCENGNSCGYGKVCCAFKEGDSVSRICAEDCSDVYENTARGSAFDITGRGTQNIENNKSPWVYILIGVILILLALFYKKNPEVVVKKKIIKTKKVKRKRKKSKKKRKR